MRTLLYLQILIIILSTIYLFTLRYELLIGIIILVCTQFLLLVRFNFILPLIYLILNLAWIGLINLPLIGFIFAVLYLLFSLFIASILKKTTFLFSSRYEFNVFTNKDSYKNSKSANNKKKYNFHSIFEDLKRPYYFSKDKIKKTKAKYSKEHRNSSNLDSKIKDAEFYEK